MARTTRPVPQQREPNEVSEVHTKPPPPGWSPRPSGELSRADQQELAEEMWRAYHAGHFSTALANSRDLLNLNPRHALAMACAAECKRQLLALEPNVVIRVIMTPAAAQRATLTHREAFILWQIDGSVTMTELLTISAMSPAETRAIITHLIGLGLIDVGE